MIAKLVIAVVVGVVVALLCTLIGTLFASFGVAWATTIGGWLVKYSSILGLLAALYEFFAGFTFTARFRK